jgi:hypothetical protein
MALPKVIPLATSGAWFDVYMVVCFFLNVVLVLRRRVFREEPLSFWRLLRPYRWWRRDEYEPSASFWFWLTLVWTLATPFAFYVLVWRSA